MIILFILAGILIFGAGVFVGGMWSAPHGRETEHGFEELSGRIGKRR